MESDNYSSDEDDYAVDIPDNYSRDEEDYVVEKNFTILEEEDIRRHQEKDINEVSTVLSISKEAACLLLHRCNWNLFKVYVKWSDDEERVRNAVGILKKPLVKFSSAKMACGICFENYSCESLQSAGCAHLFCDACWKAYISNSINNGPGCLMLRCPDSACRVAVGKDMIEKLATDEDKEKYRRYLLRSYVDDNNKIKWCPAPGCESAIQFFFGSRIYDVTCSCSYSFCWNCKEEPHRPVDCETAAKWISKNNAESENLDW